jgi:biopolymer transport protein ExbD
MNLLSRSKEEPEINLTSLIDVVLLLLVFFMVSTSFVREAEINIRLPEASADPVEATELEVLEIGITQTGEFLINGRQLRPGTDRRRLRAAIEQVMGDVRDVDVIIRADAEVDFQVAVTAMNVAGELGFNSVNIATVTTSESR